MSKRALTTSLIGCLLFSARSAQAENWFDSNASDAEGAAFIALVLAIPTAVGSVVTGVGNLVVMDREDSGRAWPVGGMVFGGLATIAGASMVGLAAANDYEGNETIVWGCGVSAIVLGAVSVAFGSVNLAQSIEARRSTSTSVAGAWFVVPTLASAGQDRPAPGVAFTLSM